MLTYFLWKSSGLCFDPNAAWLSTTSTLLPKTTNNNNISHNNNHSNNNNSNNNNDKDKDTKIASSKPTRRPNLRSCMKIKLGFTSIR